MTPLERLTGSWGGTGGHFCFPLQSLSHGRAVAGNGSGLEPAVWKGARTSLDWCPVANPAPRTFWHPGMGDQVQSRHPGTVPPSPHGCGATTLPSSGQEGQDTHPRPRQRQDRDGVSAGTATSRAPRAAPRHNGPLCEAGPPR